jgi:hypothetical protein
MHVSRHDATFVDDVAAGFSRRLFLRTPPLNDQSAEDLFVPDHIDCRK